VVDLIAASLAHLTGKQCREPSTATRLVLLKLRAVIETQLSNPNADRETIAAQAGISVRYANQLLALENTSLVRLLQERRLARCRNALQDPTQAGRSVSEIAYHWGFADVAHFSRCFKAAFGLTPTDYRKMHSFPFAVP
jgi:AraC-like DNA-binding protein